MTRNAAPIFTRIMLSRWTTAAVVVLTAIVCGMIVGHHAQQLSDDLGDALHVPATISN